MRKDLGLMALGFVAGVVLLGATGPLVLGTDGIHFPDGSVQSTAAVDTTCDGQPCNGALFSNVVAAAGDSATGFFPTGSLEEARIDSSIARDSEVAALVDEVQGEVRTPIDSLPFTINQPGSYYLTGNLVYSGAGSGITVRSGHVTIDLNGFAIDGIGSATGKGIDLGGASNVEVRNGTVRRFGQEGIAGPQVFARYNRIIDVRVEGNGWRGILLTGFGSLIKDCTIVENGLAGIDASSGSMITGNVVKKNDGGGIFGGSSSLITGNAVTSNGGYGIRTGQGSNVSGNAVVGNHLGGVRASVGTAVVGNTIHTNNRDELPQEAGIVTSGRMVVKNNSVDWNFVQNILVRGRDSLIEENFVGNSEVGINFLTDGNFFANNRAGANVTAFVGDALQIDGGGNVAF